MIFLIKSVCDAQLIGATQRWSIQLNRWRIARLPSSITGFDSITYDCAVCNPNEEKCRETGNSDYRFNSIDDESRICPIMSALPFTGRPPILHAKPVLLMKFADINYWWLRKLLKMEVEIIYRNYGICV